jgi:prolyl 4-hydroxylase
MKLDPNLMKWLNAQIARGHSRQALLKAMVDQGWSESVSRMALSHAMGVVAHSTQNANTEQSDIAVEAEPLNSGTHTSTRISTDKPTQPEFSHPQSSNPGKLGAFLSGAKLYSNPPSKPLPGPDLTGSPTYIKTSDRTVSIWTVVDHPRVVVFGNLLSDEECDALIDFANPRLERSLTVDVKTGGEQLHDARTSRGMFFSRGENDLVERVERRLAELLRWPFENGEGLQVLHYKPGAQYKPHYDYFDPKMAGTSRLVERGGQRVGTVVMYLHSPEKGGATTFPDIGLEVSPIRGSGVFFSYGTPTEESLTLHGGAPVVEGEKYVLTKWLREARFD